MPVKNCRSGAISLSVVTQARLCADENPYIAPCCPSFYPQPCFWYGCAFHPYQKHGSRARARKSVGGYRERLAAAEAGMHRHRPALLHFHRAVLELRDLADRIEHRVGELVRRRFVKAERDEHRAARGAGVSARIQ